MQPSSGPGAGDPGFPETRDWGNFIASLGSSFFYCPLPLVKLNRKIKALAPAELCGAHIFHTPEIKRIFEEINSVHFFIYRDPRDVAISEAHYLTHMNHWHRLSKYFRQLPSMEHQIKFSITGATGAHFPCYYPNIAQRFAHYNGWLKDPNTFSLRYEDLISDCKERIIRAIIEFYANKAESDIDIDTHVAIALKNINPAASHTYRQGKAGGWKKAFTDEHKRIFKRLAGDLLIELGYEKNKDW